MTSFFVLFFFFLHKPPLSELGTSVIRTPVSYLSGMVCTMRSHKNGGTEMAPCHFDISFSFSFSISILYRMDLCGPDTRSLPEGLIWSKRTTQ